jgi:rfaE bifunctional protein nucleotidyltransferase chain/domain
MSSESKILSAAQLGPWRDALRQKGRRLVVTNGCFDLLHAGHVSYLESARAEGDALLVGLNGDDSVRQLKGPARPVVPEQDRARVLAALGCIDAVCIFPEVRAIRFLDAARPDIYVKGGDYTLETINPDERQAVERHGGRIVFIPFLPGRSTTTLLDRIQRL